MLNLVLKDLLLLKKNLLFGIAYILILIISFQNLAGAAMLTAGVVALTYILVITACAYDDKNKADLLLNSLPINRNEVVGARYLSVFVFAGLAIIFYGVIGGLSGLLGLPLKVSHINGEGIVGALLAVSFMNSIYLPTYFKFGYIKSRMVNFVLFFVAFFGLGIFSKILPKNNVLGFSGAYQLLVFILMAVVLIVASYYLSLRSYGNRDF